MSSYHTNYKLTQNFAKYHNYKKERRQRLFQSFIVTTVRNWMYLCLQRRIDI